MPSAVLPAASLALLLALLPTHMPGGAAPRTVTPATARTAPVIRVGSPGRVTRVAWREEWHAGSVIQLDGSIEVTDGGTLVIEAGTRVEGRVGSYIVISKDGRIEANGTLNEPIDLNCTATSKYPGCWGGLIVHGYARINAGTPTSPVSTTRSPTGGCLSEADPIAGSQRFGGCNDADDSGVLRYIRVQYAERGLHLAGVGSGTLIQDIQANRTRAEGTLVTGGAVNVRNLFLTANGTGLRWTGGWRGKAQSIAIQQDIVRFAAGLVGQNGTTTSAAASDALPRSNPSLYNITIIAQSVPANSAHATARALVLDRGTAGTLRNIFLFAPHIGLDIAGTATCTQIASGALTLRNTLTAGATSLGEGLIAAGCPASEADLLGSATEQNVTLPGASGLLTSTNDLYLPDLRPATGSALALAPAAVPPSDGFFAAGAYIGAVPPGPAASIPWFSGWTYPAPPPAPIPSGVITGVVRSPFRGLLANVRVTDETTGETTVTNTNGRYYLSLPAGTALLDVSMLPSGCPTPQTRAGTVTPIDTATLDLQVNCPPLPGTERIAAGEGFVCGIADQGTFCWGENGFGQLGNGSTTPSVIPAAVATSFTSLSAGTHHVCGREANGIVRCWGEGTQGQLGDGAGVNRSLPAPGPGGPFQMVTSGGAHSCALALDGAVFCWGANSDGQLGNGSTSNALAPVAVLGGHLFSTIAAGRNHTCGLDLSGAAWCWGDNSDGQLGDGSTSDRTQPVAVSGGQVYAALAGGGDAHTCATGATGFVRCWGANDSGQLGNASSAASPVPVVVSTALALSQVTLGDRHTCAISTIDSVSQCWGLNSEGQLGDGTTALRASPTAAQANARFSRTTGGTAFTCAVTFGAVTGEDNVIVFSQRSLLCWGRNGSGQFGRGTTTSALTPTAAATGLTFP